MELIFKNSNDFEPELNFHKVCPSEPSLDSIDEEQDKVHFNDFIGGAGEALKDFNWSISLDANKRI